MLWTWHSTPTLTMNIVCTAELTQDRDAAFDELRRQHRTMSVRQLHDHCALEYLRFRIRTLSADIETALVARALAQQRASKARDSGALPSTTAAVAQCMHMLMPHCTLVQSRAVATTRRFASAG